MERLVGGHARERRGEPGDRLGVGGDWGAVGGERADRGVEQRRLHRLGKARVAPAARVDRHQRDADGSADSVSFPGIGSSAGSPDAPNENAKGAPRLFVGMPLRDRGRIGPAFLPGRSSARDRRTGECARTDVGKPSGCPRK